MQKSDCSGSVVACAGDVDVRKAWSVQEMEKTGRGRSLSNAPVHLKSNERKERWAGSALQVSE